MGLRARTISIIVIIMSTIIGSLYWLISHSLSKTYNEIEYQVAARNLARFNESINDELEKIRTKTTDWGVWDDMYEFIGNHNKKFIQSNLVPSLKNLQLNVLVFTNNKKTFTQGVFFDKNWDYYPALPKPMWDSITSYPDLFSFSNESETKSGIIQTPHGPMLIVSRPILKSNESGPIRGTTIGGILLNGPLFAKLKQRLRLDIEVEEIPAAASRTSIDTKDDIHPNTDNKLHAISYFKDIQGKTILKIDIISTRELHKQGQKSIFVTLVSMLTLGLILGFAMIMLIERQVLRRVIGLSESIKEINSNTDFKQRMKVDNGDEIGKLAISMNRMLHTIEASQKGLRLLLDNIGQGIFSFNAEGIIFPECSTTTLYLFGHHPTGEHIATLLKEDPKHWRSLLEIIFQQKIPFEDVLPLLPPSIKINSFIIDLQYRPIKKKDDSIKSVMVVATNVTQLRSLQKTAELERELNLSLIKIMTCKNDFLEMLELSENLISLTSSQKEFARSLHTLKGGLNVLECKTIAQNCHKWEDKLHIGKYSSLLMGKAATDINEQLNRFLEKYEHILNIKKHDRSKTISVDLKRLDRIIDMAKEHAIPADLIQEFEAIKEVPASECFAWIDTAYAQMAARLGKEVNPIKWSSSLLINPWPYKSLFQNFNHLLRNCVDHGIEDVQTRLMKGKSREGNLHISLTLESNYYVMTFEDDGPGVDIGKIKQKMLKMDLPLPAHEEDIINCIFNDKISVKDYATEYSGRGLGLPALKAAVEQYGGQINVQNIEAGGGTRFIVKFKKLTGTDIDKKTDPSVRSVA